jgi:hypothetical protein
VDRTIPETPFELAVRAIKLTLMAPTLALAEESAFIGATIITKFQFSELRQDQARALAMAEAFLERGNN